jgi:hypothetical protein
MNTVENQGNLFFGKRLLESIPVDPDVKAMVAQEGPEGVWMGILTRTDLELDGAPVRRVPPLTPKTMSLNSGDLTDKYLHRLQGRRWAPSLQHGYVGSTHLVDPASNAVVRFGLRYQPSTSPDMHISGAGIDVAHRHSPHDPGPKPEGIWARFEGNEIQPREAITYHPYVSSQLDFAGRQALPVSEHTVLRLLSAAHRATDYALTDPELKNPASNTHLARWERPEPTGETTALATPRPERPVAHPFLPPPRQP